MAALILLSALPLSSDPTQHSIYQHMMEDYTASFTVPNMTLDSLTDAICNTWGLHFGHLTDVQKPKKGTFYIPKRDKGTTSKKQVNVMQKTTAIKDKTTPPMYSDQYKSGSSQDKGKACTDAPSKPTDEKKKNCHPP
jgi:hypothetical protein